MTRDDSEIFLQELKSWIFSDPGSSLYDEGEIAAVYESLLNDLMQLQVKCKCNE